MLNQYEQDALHIPFRAEATFFLIENGLKMMTFEDMEQDEFLLLNTEKTNQYSDWCGKADQVLGTYFPEIASGDLSPFRAASLFMRKNFFKLYNEFYRIKTVLKKFPEASFYYYQDDQTVLFSEIISHFSQEVKDRFHVLGGNAGQLNLSQIDLPPINLEGQYIRLLKDVVKSLRFGSRSILESILKRPLSKRPKTLVLGMLYDGEDIAESLIQEGYDCIFWRLMRFQNNKMSKNQIEKIQKVICTKMGDTPWTTIDGIDFSRLFHPLLKKFVAKVLPECLSIFHGFQQLQNHFHFRSCFTSMPTLETQIIFRKCTLSEIPSFQTIHGGTLGVYKFFPPMPNSYLANPGKTDSFLIVYSDWLEDEMNEYRNNLNDFSPKILQLGSPYFESLYKGDRR